VGKYTALSYAKAGASGIAIGARSSLYSLEKEIKAAAKSANRAEPKILSLDLDVTDRTSVEAAAKAIEKEFGKLDILINNAGYLSSFQPMAETDPDEWWRNYEVNVKGLYLVTRYAIPLLRKSELKTVVNVTSAGGVVASRGASGYQSSKHAVIRISEFINVDHGVQGDSGEGLISYSIHPGGVKTDLAYGMPESWHAILTCEPELPADALVFLTRERREWLAGRYVSVQWDMEEFLQKRDEILRGELLKVRMAVNLFPGQ
jgi:NAD(P)-dependent dehydrogenase (short-subunit alcohol dehydrogenase family)